ncbi:hypothetical protein V6N13_137915 [Hibiscus sabdariffa]
MLEKFGKDDSGIARTPIDTSQNLSENKGQRVDQVEYARVIDSLVSCTKPGIAFTMSSLSRFTSNPRKTHWKAIVRVLRYLRYTRNYGLHYSRALDKSRKEAEWLRNVLEDIHERPKLVPTMHIHCDDQTKFGGAHSFICNGKSRHIRHRHNTIRQLISNGVISIDFVKSKDNIADPLTKWLNRDQVEKTSKGMGLKPIKFKRRYVKENPT